MMPGEIIQQRYRDARRYVVGNRFKYVSNIQQNQEQR